ncbi:hypothetical protein B0I37DRAFT_158855 [Chaetomium sp. MPI-CAGE-AT-0009]|nr:hypothetical protein B0I37DRAFT_158855 [Chaetomium sp. MPI-CAGE-AT-0009]
MFSRIFSRGAPVINTATDIATEAATTVALLDRAASQIRGCQVPGASAALSKHDNELTTIRVLIQKIRFLEDLQTPPVATALTKLKVVADRLTQVLGAGSLQASQQLANAMDEVVQAAENLRQRLPGDILIPINNEVTGSFQGNAAIGGARPDGRVITEATGNKSTDAAQVNAPMYGDPAALAQFMAALQAAGGTRR